MQTERRASRRVGLGVAAIAALALALRLVGVQYGLPAVYNPDEVAIMNRAMALGQNHLNPHNFLYPTLYFYALFAWEGLFFVVGRVVGLFDSLASFERSFFVDPTMIYIAGRALSAAFGTVTVVATWRLGAKVFGAPAGFFAAALLAVSPLAVRDAHYVKHDVPVTLLVILTHVVLAGLVLDTDRRARLRTWALVGALAGLATSTHYYAIFLVIPIAIAALAVADAGEPARVRVARLGTAALACAGAFVIASPFLPLDPGTAWQDIVANRQIVMDRATGSLGLFGALGFYLSWLSHDAMGAVTAALAVAGLIGAARLGWQRGLVLFSFPVVFLLFIANTFPASRYLNPLLPFIAVLAGAILGGLLMRGQKGYVMATLLFVGAFGEAGLQSQRVDAFFRMDDTRTLAERWIGEHVAPGATVLVQPYSVSLRMSREGLVEALTHHLGDAARASVKFQKQLVLTPYPAPAYRTIYLGSGGLDVDRLYVEPAAFSAASGLGPLRALAVEYVVVKRYNEPDRSLKEFDAALAREGRLLVTFSPYGAGAPEAAGALPPPFQHNSDTRIAPELYRPGPIIEIWRIP